MPTATPSRPHSTRSPIEAVRSLVAARMAHWLGDLDVDAEASALLPGKMLRTRLAVRLAEAAGGAATETVVRCAAAVEMAHTASLCHDDVMDSGLLRRGLPTLWRRTTCSAAVLIGDILVCDAIELVMQTAGGVHLPEFIRAIRETVAAEAQQELLREAGRLGPGDCLRLSRGKAGALFAFAAGLGADGESAPARAMRQAGRQVGTAYQLADDILDVIGTESRCGKTLGTDALRGKCTLPLAGKGGMEDARGQVVALCESALAELDAMPAVREAVAEFLLHDIQPMLDTQALGVDLRPAVASVRQTIPAAGGEEMP